MTSDCGLSAAGRAVSGGAGASGIELAHAGALLHVLWPPIGAIDEIERRIGDAEPELLADEMMAQMVLLHPAAERRARLIGDMGEVMHPFIMYEAYHDPEQQRRHARRA